MLPFNQAELEGLIRYVNNDPDVTVALQAALLSDWLLAQPEAPTLYLRNRPTEPVGVITGFEVVTLEGERYDPETVMVIYADKVAGSLWVFDTQYVLESTPEAVEANDAQRQRRHSFGEHCAMNTGPSVTFLSTLLELQQMLDNIHCPVISTRALRKLNPGSIYYYTWPSQGQDWFNPSQRGRLIQQHDPMVDDQGRVVDCVLMNADGGRTRSFSSAELMTLEEVLNRTNTPSPSRPRESRWDGNPWLCALVEKWRATQRRREKGAPSSTEQPFDTPKQD